MRKILILLFVIVFPQATLASDSATSLHDSDSQGVPGLTTLRVLSVAGADYLVGGNEFSVANDCFSAVGDHFHSNDGGVFGNGPDFVEVGDYSCEDARGMVEFGLTDPLLPRFTAEVSCFVFREGGLFNGTNDFLTTFDIDAYSYNGNSLEDLSDFQITPTYLLDTFSTFGLIVGDEVSFDVTAAYGDALTAAAALGVRLQAVTDPDGGAITFEQCSLMVTGKVVDIDIKFCSNPNAYNTKQKGATPVTIFGSATLDVTAIDRDTLQLCNDAAGLDCTPVGLKDFSMADRGDPTSDLGAAQCTLIDTDGDDIVDTETDYLNPDGFLDLDAAFYSQDVTALIGPASKGDVVGPLYLIGYLNDGTPITSVPFNSIGVDMLAIKK